MKGYPRKEDLINVPNVLCYIRILLVPVFVYLFLKELYWQSALIIVLATATDVVDGWIARHFHMITDWGKFIDPLADKFMQLAMLIMAILKNKLVIILISLFLVKEIITLIVGVYIYRKGDNLNGAMWCGKLCTVVLDASLLAIIALPTKLLADQLVYVLIAICSVLLIMSFCIYMNTYKKMYRDLKAEELTTNKESK